MIIYLMCSVFHTAIAVPAKLRQAPDAPGLVLEEKYEFTMICINTTFRTHA